jgi:pathogenesis-related protein 1
MHFLQVAATAVSLLAVHSTAAAIPSDEIADTVFLESSVDAISLEPRATTSNTWTDSILSTHNAARAKYGAKALTLNTALNASTTAYAAQCVFAHSKQDPAGQYGENLYASTSSTTGMKDAVNSWVAEVAKYNYSKPEFSSATGHFTQVVWKNTKTVTCAIASCKKGTIFADYASKYIVCRYTPPGNYVGQFAANVGKPVS